MSRKEQSVRAIISEMERDDCTPASIHTDECGNEAIWLDGWSYKAVACESLCG